MQRSTTELRILDRKSVLILAKSPLVDNSASIKNNKEMDILRKIYAFFVDTIQTLLLAASIFLIIYAFVMRPFQVSGESMHPTFKNNEYILTNLIGLRFGELKKGDVIVFKSPTDEEKDYIKRVIALPGDRISLENGSVFVNEEQASENKYLNQDIRTYGGSFLQENETVVVPEEHYFVMGDNRPYSSDSREWGFLSKKEIIGKSFYVYWPPKNMRMIKNPFME